jgi:DNA repair exonuclease SbcCD ATPase subunit
MSASVFQPQRLKFIRVKNFCRLETADVEIDESDRIIPVFGENGSGKSSLARSIVAALCGKDGCPDDPLHNGADSAEIELGLTDHTVLREFRKDADGYKTDVIVDGRKNSQTSLNALLGGKQPIAFYPLRFLDAKDADQADMLRTLVGANFSDLDTARFKAEEARKPVNQEVNRLKGLVKSLPFHEDAPSEPKSLAEVRNRQKQAQAKQREFDAAQSQAMTTEGNILTAQSEIFRLEEELGFQRDLLGRLQIRAKEELERLAAIRVPNLQTIEAELDSIEEVNAKVAANASLVKAKEDLAKQETEAKRLTTTMEKCDADKDARLAKLKMPVEGLSFDSKGLVTFKGHPFSQASGRDRALVAASLGALHGSPRLRFGIIEDANRFDRRGVEMLESVAEELDMVFLFLLVAEEEDIKKRSGVAVVNGHAYNTGFGVGV